MKKIALLLAISYTSIASAQITTDLTKIKRDVKFAKCAAKDELMEIRLGGLAETSTTTSAVKTPAKQMVEDHTKANEELKALSAKKAISLPSILNEMQQKHYDNLAKLNGKDFDKHYVKCMIKYHKKTLCLFKKEAKKGKDAELKAWANGQIPTIKKHLQLWKDTCKMIKNS